MDVYCTRPTCPKPINHFPELNDSENSQLPPQRYCSACGMKLVLGGRYIPIQLLGAGSFGVTFLARDRNTTERKCIVKQLRPTSEFKPEQLAQVHKLFATEATMLEQLGDISSQIPTLFDSFTVKVEDRDSGAETELYYLVQQYIDGEDLAVCLQRQGNFSELEVITFLHQILPVLQLVHDRQVIHRDIKPANIMRSQSGQLYLIDFGAVKQIMSGVPSQQSIVIGTEGYAPIEQIMGRAVYPASDLYALAVSCLSLLTGSKPTDRDFNDFIDAWRERVKISPELADVLDRMLKHDRIERYQSATEVLSALDDSNLLPERAIYHSGGSIPLDLSGGSTSLNRSIVGTASRREHLPVSTNQVAQPVINLWESIRHSALVGSVSWLLAVGIVSALGTAWYYSGLWLIILGGAILYRYAAKLDRLKLFGAAVVSNLAIFSLFSPQKVGSLATGGFSGITVLILLLILTISIFFALLMAAKLISQLSVDRQ
jgi:serine/threonine protein kinase